MEVVVAAAEEVCRWLCCSNMCAVYTCALRREREAAVVGEVEVATAAAEEVGVVCDWHRQCRDTVGCLTGGGVVEVVGEEVVAAAEGGAGAGYTRCGERPQ